MKVLFDNTDQMPLALVQDDVTLAEAVEVFLRITGEWDNPEYFSDGDQTLSAQEFVNDPTALDEEFSLFLPERTISRSQLNSLRKPTTQKGNTNAV